MSRETKDALLDAAEALFAEQGFSATSLRTITAAAGANLAAVNYHFGSKQALIEAVLARRLVPMNAERLRRLGALVARTPESAIALEDLIRAFAGPPLEMSREQGQGGQMFIRLLGRTYSEPLPELQSAMRDMYADVVEAFRPAFAQALPALSAEELRWRLHFLVGLLAYLMAGSDLNRLIASSRHIGEGDIDRTLDRLVTFVSAGMRAGCPATQTRVEPRPEPAASPTVQDSNERLARGR